LPGSNTKAIHSNSQPIGRDALIALLRLTEEAQAVGAMMIGWTELSADEVDPRIVRAGAIYFERTGKQLSNDLGALIDTIEDTLERGR
jgi:hypothetical protein